MKYTLLLTLISLSAFGQNGYKPSSETPPEPQVSRDSLYVTGLWTAIDKTDRPSQLAGPSVSEISCDRKEGVCHESQANMSVFKDGSFTLSADQNDYTVSHWDSKQIVAQHIGGICKVRTVLKFELETKKIYALTALSEPLDSKMPQMSKDICNSISMRLELHGNTTFYPAK